LINQYLKVISTFSCRRRQLLLPFIPFLPVFHSRFAFGQQTKVNICKDSQIIFCKKRVTRDSEERGNMVDGGITWGFKFTVRRGKDGDNFLKPCKVCFKLY
jgi:hypothetical protein